jgi:hypothetical protein
MMLVLLALTLHSINAQITVDVQILPDPNNINSPPPVLNLDTLVSNGGSQGLTGFQGVNAGTVDVQLYAQMCAPGTYSQLSGACIPCPAGTASATNGASDPSTCIPCPTGAYASAGSSVCTDCRPNTFSVVPLAPDITVCQTCPIYTSSNAESDNVDQCVCNSGYFLSDNILSVSNGLTYDAVSQGIANTLAFSSLVSIDVAHVTCF